LHPEAYVVVSFAEFFYDIERFKTDLEVIRMNDAREMLADHLFVGIAKHTAKFCRYKMESAGSIEFEYDFCSVVDYFVVVGFYLPEGLNFFFKIGYTLP